MKLRLLTGALVLGSAALGFVPIAQADTTSTTLAPDADGWYQPNPSCTTPAGCVTTGLLPVAPPAEPPTSPFPARTLHIGIAGGTETARSYLAFPLYSLTGTLSGATLTVPLDVAQASGSIQPEIAKVQACPTLGTVVDADGAIGEPPFIDCSASVAMTYVATPQPHLEGDLAPIASGLASATGIALLPDATKAAPNDVWRVVFSAHNRTDAAKTPPAALTVELETPDVPDEPLPEVPVDTPTFGAVAPPVGTGFAATVPDLTPAAPVVVPPAPAASPPTTQPELVTVGYAYPGVWILPLVFLVLVPAIGRSLTKDLTAGIAPTDELVIPA